MSFQNLSKVPIPLKQLLVGAGFWDGSTRHHQDMVHVGQPMKTMGHQDSGLNEIQYTLFYMIYTMCVIGHISEHDSIHPIQ